MRKEEKREEEERFQSENKEFRERYENLNRDIEEERQLEIERERNL